jgi:hypothetical protein
MLDTVEVGSVSELAERMSVDRAYISRTLPLTLLAPDIIEAIIAGREASGLPLAMLSKEIPMGYEEQRGYHWGWCENRGEGRAAMGLLRLSDMTACASGRGRRQGSPSEESLHRQPGQDESEHGQIVEDQTV